MHTSNIIIIMSKLGSNNNNNQTACLAKLINNNNETASMANILIMSRLVIKIEVKNDVKMGVYKH